MIICIMCVHSLYVVKYELLGTTVGGYSHSLPYSILGSCYVSDILDFLRQTVISIVLEIILYGQRTV